MRSRFTRYLLAAFNARPLGMPVPPNWVGLGAFAALGFLNPGLWIIGAGLEALYLFALLSSERFRRLVDGRTLAGSTSAMQDRMKMLLDGLGQSDLERYRLLEQRCRVLLSEQRASQTTAVEAQWEGLGRLLWVYLQLLATRQAIAGVIATPVEGRGRHDLEKRLSGLQARLSSESLDETMKRSLQGQMDIVQQRLEARRDAAAKLEYIDSELARVEEQVHLLREQAVLDREPESVSGRIDAITNTLGTTTQWIREQNKIYGLLADGLDSAHTVTLPELDEGLRAAHEEG